MDDSTRFLQKIRESTANKKHEDGHAEHTDDCMSPWAEERRGILTPQTVAVNHQLHMADVEEPAGGRGGGAPDWRKIAHSLHWIINSGTPLDSTFPREILAEFEAASGADPKEDGR